MSSSRPLCLTLIALLILCFGLAARLEPWFRAWEVRQGDPGDAFSVLLGDSRTLFANQFFVKADAYYHSGYYPTIFDNNQAFQTPHIAEDTGAVASKNKGEDDSFMGPTRDWIDAFDHHFIPNRHTHLDQGGPAGDLSGSEKVGEILPWLKLSAALDPEDIRTYLVTAYWLRRMGKINEAERVLREGLRYNPGSCELLFELGRLFNESDHDTNRASNVWRAGLRYWEAQSADAKTNTEAQLVYEETAMNLAQSEESQGHWPQAVEYLKLVKQVSPDPDAIQKQIDEARMKINTGRQ